MAFSNHPKYLNAIISSIDIFTADFFVLLFHCINKLKHNAKQCLCEVNIYGHPGAGLGYDLLEPLG